MIQMTVRELRRLFFDTPTLYGVLFADEMTNSEIRRALFDMPNQDKLFNVIQDNNCLLISNIK